MSVLVQHLIRGGGGQQKKAKEGAKLFTRKVATGEVDENFLVEVDCKKRTPRGGWVLVYGDCMPGCDWSVVTWLARVYVCHVIYISRDVWGLYPPPLLSIRVVVGV